MATTKKKASARTPVQKRARSKRAASPRANKEKSLFGAAAVKRAKRVTPIVRVRRKDTGQLGTVTAVKSGFLKVKWDNADKSAFARASTLQVVNGAKSSLRTRAIAETKKVQRKGAKPPSVQRKPLRKPARSASRSKGPVANGKKKRVTTIKARVIRKVVINKAKPGSSTARRAGGVASGQARAIKAFKAMTSRKGAKPQRTAKKNSGRGNDSSVRSPTSTSSDVRSPTRTSTKAHTSGNVTVTGGAGAGATTTVKITQAKRNAVRKRARNQRATNGTAQKRTGRPRSQSGGAVRKEFLGRWPTKVIKVNASHHMPQTPRPDVLGRVEEIKVKGHGIIKMPAASKLISTAGKTLWITERIAKPNPAGDKNTVHPLGELQHVVYHAHKSPRMDSLGQTHFKENRKVAYIHKMGEDSGKRPMLYVDHDGFAVLKGGNYTIDWRGIID